MVTILPEAPGFGSSLGKALGGGLNQGLNQGMQFAQQMALKKQASEVNFNQSLMKEQHKANLKKEEKLTPVREALKVVDRQLERLASGKLGPKFGFAGGLYTDPKLTASMSKEGQEVRSGYEQAGKSLIGLASTLPIKNRLEFEILGEKLYDPTMSESQIKGVYEEMRSRLEEALEEGGGTEERPSENEFVMMQNDAGENFKIPKKFINKAKAKGLR